MSRRRVTVEADATTFVLRGWRSRELAAEAGVKVIYAGSVSGWLGDRERLPDLLAYLEHRHIAVDVSGVEDQPAEMVIRDDDASDADELELAETERGLW